MRVPASYRTRCFSCRQPRRIFPSSFVYWSFTRGSHWRVPICGPCMAAMLRWADARRAVAS